MVACERGVCGIGFKLNGGREVTLKNLFLSLGDRPPKYCPDQTKKFVVTAFRGGKIKVILRGTPFQLTIWNGLLRIPSGEVISYEGLARSLGMPGAARAVASAIARNPVSWLVPCHRVLRSSGSISGYRWGRLKKCAMIAIEMANASN